MPPAKLLPEKLRFELWRRIENRLRLSEVIIADDQFIQLMTRDFRRLVRKAPSKRVKEEIASMVSAVNRDHPETFLALGIRNAVTRYVNGGHTQGEREKLWQKVKDLIKEGQIPRLLELIGIDAASLTLTPAVETAIKRMANRRRQQRRADPGMEAATARKRRSSGTGMAPVTVSGADEVEAGMVQQLTVTPPLSEQEQQAWIAQEEKEEAALRGEEEVRFSQHMESYLRHACVDEEDVEALRTLSEIAGRLQRGEIDEATARLLREQVPEDRRQPLELKMRQISEFAVLYKRLLEGLKRIPTSREDALRFLIEHRALVAQGGSDAELDKVLETLEDDEELAESLVRIVDRRDQEIRLIGGGLPPYRALNGQHQSTDLEQLEPSFLEDMRLWDRDQLSDLFNGESEGDGERTAASIRALVELIGKLLVPGPFFKLIQWLKIKKTLVRYYNSAGNPQQGRKKVQSFLNGRLPSIYPDMTKEEHAEIVEKVEALLNQMSNGEQEDKGDNRRRVYRA